MTPLLFSYLNYISLWPIAKIQGYPFFSPLIPLASSDKFLTWVGKIRGNHKNFTKYQPNVHFYWIEPRAYKQNLLKDKGKVALHPKLVARQLTEDLKKGIARFKSQFPTSKHKLIMLAPESSFPFKINEFPQTIREWANLMEPGMLFAFGTYRTEGKRTYRTTCIIDHQGIKQFLDKQNLMPFTEKHLTSGSNQLITKAPIDECLTLVPLVCFEFFIDGSTVRKADAENELPVIFANDFWFPHYFKILLRNQARLSAVWYGKKLIYLSHYQDLCISPFSANL